MEIAEVLAAAFAEDRLMTALLGIEHWQRIGREYFLLQLAHADHAIAMSHGNRIVSALLARSPRARMPGWRAAIQALRVKRLLGDHFAPSQQMAHAVAARVPRDNHWYINQIGTLPTYQSAGLGRSMLETLASIRGHDPVYVDCEPALTAFYENAGYKLIASTEDQEMVVLGLN